MKILVTGGLGFVGSHLCKELEREHEVIVYDLVKGDDIRDRFKLDRMFESENFDVLINLAARAGVRRGEDFPEEYFSTNVIGLVNLIEMAEKYQLKKFIHFSSSSVYGAQNENVATKEDDEKNPRSIYGITKLAGELLLKKSKLAYIIIRPFTIIGENGRKEMVIYKWLNQHLSGRPISFYGDGSTFRGYTYIGDMIEGVKLCLNERIQREDFNLGGHQKIYLSELLDIFKELFPDVEVNKLEMPSSDQPYSFADTSKAEKMLGWKPAENTKGKIRSILASAS